MKSFRLISCILAVGLVVNVPNIVFAHVGHGDEFQAEGGIQRVQVNTETDSLLGIIVTPIAPAADGISAVMIPATALVDANGKQLVFVQYENFYEPVEVTTGATKGELIEITKGLSVAEKLVTQGSLSLYAESRKSQSANASPSSAPIASSQASPQSANTSPSSDAIASPKTPNTHAQADAQGIPHSHDASGNMAQNSGDVAQNSGGFPMGIVAAVGGGAVLLVGALAVIGNRNKGDF